MKHYQKTISENVDGCETEDSKDFKYYGFS